MNLFLYYPLTQKLMALYILVNQQKVLLPVHSTYFSTVDHVCIPTVKLKTAPMRTQAQYPLLRCSGRLNSQASKSATVIAILPNIYLTIMCQSNKLRDIGKLCPSLRNAMCTPLYPKRHYELFKDRF